VHAKSLSNNLHDIYILSSYTSVFHVLATGFNSWFRIRKHGKGLRNGIASSTLAQSFAPSDRALTSSQYCITCLTYETDKQTTANNINQQQQHSFLFLRLVEGLARQHELTKNTSTTPPSFNCPSLITHQAQVSGRIADLDSPATFAAV
jgi:hypothetical protein